MNRSEINSPDPRHQESSTADCLAALARVQMALAQAALAQARAELSGTRADGMPAWHQARHNGLAGLPNRSVFLERLENAMSEAAWRHTPLALLYFYLDGFKPVNDLHGREAGDELLRFVAARLSRVVRVADMVSRLGGDEFGCLRADQDRRARLGLMAEKLFDVVAAPMKIARLELSVRPSIGIALCPTDGATSGELLRNADAAMYSAKQKRTGYAFFDRRSASRGHGSSRLMAKRSTNSAVSGRPYMQSVEAVS